MRSKVLLISPNRCASPDPVFPLGLAHVSAALEQAGHETRLLDVLADPPTLSEALREFARRSPNWIVGDPGPKLAGFVARLRSRGAVGPLWSYFAMLQRLVAQGATEFTCAVPAN